MWPTTLDMTRDECRGILRRLELETYSNVISTFRAQGGLSEAKVKILEELRNMFHITQDRHRAEARRAANDEQLCTIAEIISGPNTAYEWSKEGRRPYPLLPRTPAATAFAAVANGVADVVTNENSKLPYPSETARKNEPASVDSVETEKLVKRVITKDPEVAAVERKLKLKRSLSLAEQMAALVPESKKRTISVQSNVQSPAPTPVHSNTQIQQLYNSHSKTQSKPKKVSNRKSTASARTKSSSGPNKSQKNAKNSESLSSSSKNYVTNQRNLHSYASNAQPATVHEETCKTGSDSEKHTKRPLIATSKKDITNNLSKLNMVSGIHTLPVQQPNVTSIATQQFKHHELQLKDQQTTKQVKIFYSSDHVQPDNSPTAVEKLVNNSNLITTPGDVSEVSWSTKAGIPSVSDQSTIINNKPLLSAKIPTKLTILSQSHGQNVLTPNVLNQVSESSQIISPTSLQTVPQTINLKARNVNDTSSYKIISSEMALPKLEIISNPDNRTSMNIGNVNNAPLTLKQQSIPATSKQKVHITSQQIICPPGGAKIPQNIILKSFPNNKNLKIISSAGGKMFIQSNDSAKTIAKVVTSKNILPNTTLATNVQSTNQPTNRIAVQKVQILPTSPNKPVTFSKPNMVLMQTMSNNLLSQSSTGNVIVRSTPIKTLKSPQETEKPITDISCSNVIKNQNNVIVIGAISTDKTPKDTKVASKTMSESSMITEDTPVDILTTPITVIDDALSINQISKETPIDLKSTNVSVLQPMSPVISSTVGKKVAVKRENVDRAVVVGVKEAKIIQPAIVETNVTQKETVNYPGNTTDWEMELDQEAHKQARSQYLKTRTVGRTKKISVGNKPKSFNDSSESAIDHFNEVIEETLDDDSMIANEATGEEDVEFDVSYVEAQEDTEESTGIEYIEDTTQSMSDDTMDTQDEQQVQKFHINTKINTPNYVECTTNGKATSDVRQLESTEVMFEMQEIDENGLSHVRRLTLEELLATGQVTNDLQESALTAVTNTKCISE